MCLGDMQHGSSGAADLCGPERATCGPVCAEGRLPVLHRPAGLHQELLLHELLLFADPRRLYSAQELRGEWVGEGAWLGREQRLGCGLRGLSMNG